MINAISVIILALYSSLSFAVNPEALIMNSDVQSWYQSESSHRPGDHFGIYGLEYHDGTIYVGFGTNRPAESDGALLASLPMAGGFLEKVSYLREQGFIDMMITGDYLHIPGADPAFPPHTWASGNWYLHDLKTKRNEVELKRNLPFVVHGWGQWYHEETQTLYHATSQVTCDIPTDRNDCFRVQGAKGHGALFKSTNMAKDWKRMATDEQGIGTYRTYDVTGTEDALFITWADYDGDNITCGLAVKDHSSNNWQRVSYLTTRCLERLITYDDSVLSLSANNRSMVMISDNASYSRRSLPAQPSPGSFHHFATNKNLDLFYASNKGIYKAKKGSRSWTLISGTENITDARSLIFIEKENALLVATPEQIFKIKF